MRLVSHPNVVELKAFFYSNGDKVSCLFLDPHSPTNPTPNFNFVTTKLIIPAKERRSVPQSCARIRPRDCIPRKSPLRQTQATDAHASNQVIHVPATSLSRLHTLCWDLSPGHKTTKPPPQPGNRRLEIV